MLKYIELYKQYLLVEKGLSLNSVKSYVSDIKQYFNFSNENMGEEYIWYLQDNNYNSSSINRKLSSLNNYYKFLMKNKFIDNNPFLKIDHLKEAKYLPIFLTEKEMEKLLNYDGEEDLLSQLVLELLYATGVRVSELISLKINDINFIKKTIKVTGKGSKQRYIPIGDVALEKIKQYLSYLKESIKNKQQLVYLFNLENGKILSRQQVHKIIKRRVVAAGINKNISAHTFRHSFATHLLDNGANLREVQILLGHEDIKTTMIYTHITTRKLVKDYDKYFKRSE